MPVHPINGGGGGSGTVTEIDTGSGLTGGPITNSGTVAMNPTGVTPGSYTNINGTVNDLGQLTSATNGSTSGGVEQVNTGTGLTGGPITDTGTIALADSGVVAGSYSVPELTVNAQGQITEIGEVGVVNSIQLTSLDSSVAINPPDPQTGVAIIDLSATPTFPTQKANNVLAGPASGSDADPTFRTLVAGDLPAPDVEVITDDSYTIQASDNNATKQFASEDGVINITVPGNIGFFSFRVKALGRLTGVINFIKGTSLNDFIGLDEVSTLTLQPGQVAYCSIYAAPGSGIYCEVDLNAPILKTNGTINDTQGLLNLIAGTNVTLTDDGEGGITIDAAGAGGGTVTSVEITSSTLSLSGTNPITESGTIDIELPDFTGIAYGTAGALSAATASQIATAALINPTNVLANSGVDSDIIIPADAPQTIYLGNTNPGLNVIMPDPSSSFYGSGAPYLFLMMANDGIESDFQPLILLDSTDTPILNFVTGLAAVMSPGETWMVVCDPIFGTQRAYKIAASPDLINLLNFKTQASDPSTPDSDNAILYLGSDGLTLKYINSDGLIQALTAPIQGTASLYYTDGGAGGFTAVAFTLNYTIQGGFIFYEFPAASLGVLAFPSRVVICPDTSGTTPLPTDIRPSDYFPSAQYVTVSSLPTSSFFEINDSGLCRLSADTGVTPFTIGADLDITPFTIVAKYS